MTLTYNIRLYNNSVAVKRNNCAKLSKSVKLGMDVAEYILNGS